MNWDNIKGNWKELTGKVKEQWGLLTDDEITAVAGRRDQLIGLLHQRYGIAKEQAEIDADAFAVLNKPELTALDANPRGLTGEDKLRPSRTPVIGQRSELY